MSEQIAPEKRIRTALEKARNKGFIPAIFSIEKTENPEADFVVKFAQAMTQDIAERIAKYTPLSVISFDVTCLYVRVPPEWVSAPTVDMFPDLPEEEKSTPAAPPEEPKLELAPDVTLRLRIAYHAAVQSARTGLPLPVHTEDLQMTDEEIKQQLVSKNWLARGLTGGYHITPNGCKILGVEYPKRQPPLEPLPEPLGAAHETQSMSLVLTVKDGDTFHPTLDEHLAAGWRVVYRQYLVTVLPNGEAAMRLAVQLDREVITAPQQHVARAADSVATALTPVPVAPSLIMDPASLLVRQPVMNSVEQKVEAQMLQFASQQLQAGYAAYQGGRRRD